MSYNAPNNHEIKGSFHTNPFAELLREITEAKLSGSFRLSHEANKVVVYLKQGQVVFAVSNLRQHRLFEILLQNDRISKDILAEITDFTNDFVFSETLISREILSKEEIDAIFAYQIQLILQTVLNWESGEWSFNTLARIKDSIHFNVNWNNLLVDYARNLSSSIIIKRFSSFDESFGLNLLNSPNLNLFPTEAFIISRLGDSLMQVRDIKNLSGLSDEETLKNLYVLWLGNFLIRRNWNSVISENKVKSILSAKLSLVKESAPTPIKVETQTIENQSTPIEVSIPQPAQTKIEDVDEKQLIETYLKRVEVAESYYEMLEIPIKATLPEIKTAYFKLAKSFHPDKYHQEMNTKLQQRIQDAFAEIARGYETLKDETKREIYDFRLRKYLETVKTNNIKPTGTTRTTDETPGSNNNATIDRANEEFEQGFNLLMNEDYYSAMPFLTRAAQMSPDTAKYRAYHGKVLSFDDKQKHKAESEIQTAIKLDPTNSTYRIMLVEIFIQFGLLRRAEGELQRFLTANPGNREAQALLDSLPKK